MSGFHYSHRSSMLIRFGGGSEQYIATFNKTVAHQEILSNWKGKKKLQSLIKYQSFPLHLQ